MQWYLIVHLTCVSLIANYFEWLLMCIGHLYITLMKYLFVLSLIFFNWIFLFLLLCFDSSIIIDNLDTFNQVCGLQITFPRLPCVFILFTWPFLEEKIIFFQYLKGCATPPVLRGFR